MIASTTDGRLEFVSRRIAPYIRPRGFSGRARRATAGRSGKNESEVTNLVGERSLVRPILAILITRMCESSRFASHKMSLALLAKKRNKRKVDKEMLIWHNILTRDRRQVEHAVRTRISTAIVCDCVLSLLTSVDLYFFFSFRF